MSYLVALIWLGSGLFINQNAKYHLNLEQSRIIVARKAQSNVTSGRLIVTMDVFYLATALTIVVSWEW